MEPSLKSLAPKLIGLLISLICLLLLPNTAWCNEQISGEGLFQNHCSGCHINGGNIIRRRKTLKLTALNRNGIDNPEAIAKIARLGIGSMSGYEKVLGEN